MLACRRTPDSHNTAAATLRKSLMLRTRLLAALVLLAPGLAQAAFIDHFATGDDIGLDKAPHLGTSSILVIPVIVDEDDLPTESEVLNQVTPFYGHGSSGFTFHNYYDKASLGRFNPMTVL